MKTKLFLLCGAILLLATIMPVSAGGYSDNHNDSSLSDWTSKGKRGWIESGGYAIPKGQTNSKGYLINNYPCASKGTFTFTFKGSGDQNSLDGGGVFRFTDINHFYFVTVNEANSCNKSPDNALRLRKNSTDARCDFVTIRDSLDFTDLKSVYTIKILLQGSTFTFWLNGDSLGQYIDTANPSGSVGYAYDDLFDPYVGFDSSSWIDAVSQFTWDISTTNGIQAGSGTWGIDDFWTTTGGDGASLVKWPGKGNGATFAGADGNYAITVNNVQEIDSIAFLSSGYTLSGGTINFGTNNGMYVDAGKTAVIGSAINGSAGVSKYGGGALTVTGANTFTGATAVSAGTLLINGSLAAGSAVTVSPNATLGGTGVCSGPVTVSGGSIAPGNSGPGKLSTGSLALDSASTLNFDLGGKSDTLIVSGALTLDGTINLSAAAGFSTGVYRLIAFSGTITDNGLGIGSWPTGYTCNLVSGNGYVDAVISRRLIQADPKDTAAFAGRSVSFTVSAQGTGALVYKWLRYPSDSVGNAATLSIASVAPGDANARFRCVVRDTIGADSSQWALLTVLAVLDTSRPKAAFSFTPKSGKVPLSIAFTDASTGTITLRVWRFGDNTVSTEANPTHIYTKDSVYTVTLIVSGSNGTDSLVKRDSVFVFAEGSNQAVALFDSSKTCDTTFAFSDNVLLWKDASYTIKTPIVDTLEMRAYSAKPQGMIVVGQPFQFKKGNSVLPFSIGIRIGPLPAGRSPGDVRMYRDSAGSYSVCYESIIDSVHRIVSVKTADLRWPFIAMIDTARPGVMIFSDTASAVYSTEKLIDYLRIDDNIVNVRWKYFYGSGDSVPRLRMEKELHGAGSAFPLIVPDTLHVISAESGLRAFLLVTDGAHSDTINLSRPVFRFESDKRTTEANVWTPVYPTATLKNKDPGLLVAQLLKNHTTQTYDQRYVRLFRWFNYSENQNSASKWIEYDANCPMIRSCFDLEPGRIVWLKTNENISINLDSAQTLSLKDTFSMDLPAQQWTDFGMPYRFGVRLEEILSVSGGDGDSILFYAWEKASSSNTYSLEPLYVRGMPDKFDRSSIIDYQPGGGYSLYNNSLKTVRMRVPPILPAMGKKLAKATKLIASSWSTKFMARLENGTSLPAVYFGYAPGIKKSDYPLAPSFGSLILSVIDRAAALRFGHYIHEDAKEGFIKELMISNDADTPQTIHYHLEKTGAFPEKYSANCFNVEVKKFEISGTITIAPKSTASRWIVVGDAAFQQKFITKVMSLAYSLHSLYPNPARSAVNIRYTVPFGSENRIRIAIYNIQGKRVWEKRIDDPLSEGDHLVTWKSADGRMNPASCGLYLVRLSIIDAQNKIIKQFEQRVTLMR